MTTTYCCWQWSCSTDYGGIIWDNRGNYVVELIEGYHELFSVVCEIWQSWNWLGWSFFIFARVGDNPLKFVLRLDEAKILHGFFKFFFHNPHESCLRSKGHKKEWKIFLYAIWTRDLADSMFANGKKIIWGFKVDICPNKFFEGNCSPTIMATSGGTRHRNMHNGMAVECWYENNLTHGWI